ncbi:hypothetical protein [Caldithrix abyssi]|uniref:Uncharacterized protein n=1 Tax=Caldithrix abyssi DSM 13497 TaxID=880073 RepID=H1XZ01_CALAY|nr:hypothetical protein [Caldithrix abyssi]APF18025.1 hypothetical protein Cabys_1276 [Caldithrix abyssi DSM 13497]EHO42072.1 hypothetical protein Calab_2462 [Caldithrix abyssi DSM 13497]
MARYLTVFILMAFLSAGSLFADRRNYVWTYQYKTMSGGNTELELYQTTRISTLNFWEYRVEVEHGLTDHWDFSVYQIFSQWEGEAFQWEAVQFRTRYRFGEVGQYILDPLIYFEYIRKIDFNKPNKIELRLILGKQLNRFNLAMNPIYEFMFAPGLEHELGYDMGISYEFSPKFVAGLETVTRLEFEEGETEIGSYLGPTVSFASGEWWYTIGALFGLNEHADTMRVRFLMGIGL